MADNLHPSRGLRVIGGHMEVHDLSGDTAELADRPDVAAAGLEGFDDALGAAGGKIEGDVRLRTIVGLRLIRSDDGGSTTGG